MDGARPFNIKQSSVFCFSALKLARFLGHHILTNCELSQNCMKIQILFRWTLTAFDLDSQAQNYRTKTTKNTNLKKSPSLFNSSWRPMVKSPIHSLKSEIWTLQHYASLCIHYFITYVSLRSTSFACLESPLIFISILVKYWFPVMPFDSYINAATVITESAWALNASNDGWFGLYRTTRKIWAPWFVQWPRKISSKQRKRYQKRKLCLGDVAQIIFFWMHRHFLEGKLSSCFI